MWDTGSTSTVCHIYYDDMYISEENPDISGSGINVPLQWLPTQMCEYNRQYLLKVDTH